MISSSLCLRRNSGSVPTIALRQLLAVAAGAVLCGAATAQEKSPVPPAVAGLELAWMQNAAPKLTHELVARHGESQKARLTRGLSQVAQLWRAEDGDQASFEEFVRTNFAGDQGTLDTLFNRFEHLQEQLDGHMHEINREFTQQLPREAEILRCEVLIARKLLDDLLDIICHQFYL